MKRIISILLCLMMAFVFTACSKNDTGFQSSMPMQSDTFVEPDEYATILSVKDIPEFKFYLDEEGNILAVEPLTETAKEIANNLDLKEKDLEKTIESIVIKSHEKGYINDKATVSFSIDETKQEKAETDNILSKASQVIAQAAEDLKIQIEINNNSNGAEDTNTKSENTTSNSSNKNNNTSTQNKHIHSFSVATCTQPKKCSCGTTEGNALGHKWIEATCMVAKTCSVCKMTEGNKAAHKYVKGVCSVCKQKDPEFKSFRGGTYEMKFESDFYEDTLIISTLQVAKDNEKLDGFSDMIASYRGYISFDRQYDYGLFFTLPEYEIWEGNGKRQPTREEALNIAKGKNMILYYNSKPYYAEACLGDGDPFEDIVFSENALTLDSYYNNAIIKFEYDGYDTLKFTSVPEGTLDKYDIKTGSVMTRKK